MAREPKPRSYNQILGDEIDTFLSKFGIKSLKVGGAVLSVLEATAQSQFRSTQDIFNLLAQQNLDNAKGIGLDRIGESEDIVRFREAPSSGLVTVTDTSFAKVQTKISAASGAPIVGSTSIAVVDATFIDVDDQIYIGRRTANYEGPITITSKTDFGTHWILGLATPTTKFHNHNESVTRAEGGNRTIDSGTIIRTPQSELAESAEFSILYDALLPDGEVELEGVQVVCTKPGTSGNVPKGAISEFDSPPFEGAGVTNPLPLVNGLPEENDDAYRERIRNTRRSRQLGTPLAIKSKVLGATAPDESRRVSSVSYVSRPNEPATLYIDDGTGYEEHSAGIAIETLMDEAVGGEDTFQLTNRPITKAFAVAQNTGPYILTPGKQLTVRVGGTEFVHEFDPADFVTMTAASAHEVVSSINSNDTIAFSARTLEGGTRFAIQSKFDTNEDVQVIAVGDVDDANDVFQLPTSRVYSLRLFKNDLALNKDGVVPIIYSNQFVNWVPMSGFQTIKIQVDGVEQNVTIGDVDFVNNDTGFKKLGKNNIAAWVKVLNAKIAGITARAVDNIIEIRSNLGADDRAKLKIIEGSLVTNRMFQASSACGLTNDYTLDRNTGQVLLKTPLLPGDSLSAGSLNTRSFIQSEELDTVTIASDGLLWFSVDGDASLIPHGVDPTIDFEFSTVAIMPWGYLMALESLGGPVFQKVQSGDWLMVWDEDEDVPERLLGAWRVSCSNTESLLIERESMYAARYGHASCVRPTGAGHDELFVFGGNSQFHPDSLTAQLANGPVNSAEKYDPLTGIWTPIASMTDARAYATATALNDGRILVVGGIGKDGQALASIEIYNPVNDTWAAGPNTTLPTAGHTATLLNDGTVLIAGGHSNHVPHGRAWIFNPSTNLITSTLIMIQPRYQHSAVKLNDGSVLLAGGRSDQSTTLAHCEKFTGGFFGATGAMVTPRYDFALGNINTTQVSAAGNGYANIANGRKVETYSVGGGTWAAQTDLPYYSVNTPYMLDETGQLLLTHAFTYNASAAEPKVPAPNMIVGATGNISSVPHNIFHAYPRVVFGAACHRLTIPGAFRMVVAGGLDCKLQVPVAFAERYYDDDDDDGPVRWDGTEAPTTFKFVNTGLAFARSNDYIQEVHIPAATNYTAQSLARLFDEALLGASTKIYRTNTYRINTGTYDVRGDIAFLAANPAGSTLGITPSAAEPSLVGHVGSVETGSTSLGTPSFEVVQIKSVGPSQLADGVDSLYLSTPNVDGGHSILGVKNYHDATVTYTALDGLEVDTYTRLVQKHIGNQHKFWTGFVTPEYGTTNTRVDTRRDPARDWSAFDRVILTSPFAIGPEDELTVLVDGDTENKRFVVPMGKTLKPASNVYGADLEFLDGDTEETIAKSFGLEYDFDDFALYMPARAKLFEGDPTRTMVARYYRQGAEGELARLKIAYAGAPDQEIAVTTEHSQNNLDITIQLNSGEERTDLALRATTHIGFALTSIFQGVGFGYYFTGFTVRRLQRDGLPNQTNRIDIELPSDIDDCGLNVGDTVFLNSLNALFNSGSFEITGKDPKNTSTGFQSIYFMGDHLGGTSGDVTAANLGSISFDVAGEATFNDSGIVSGDLVRIREGATFIPFGGSHSANRVSSVGPQRLNVAVHNPYIGITTTVVWTLLEKGSNFLAYANPGSTATDLAAAVNALADAENSTCPVRLTTTGTGSGLITVSTPELFLTSDGWWYLKDGHNYVARTILPANNTINHRLVFKMPVTSSLINDADWANEDVTIVPITAESVAKWLTTPAISGLFTVANTEDTTDGTRVQIATKTPGSAGSVQIQGGSSNLVTTTVTGSATATFDDSFEPKHAVATVLASEILGLRGGMWVSVDNVNPLPKSVFEFDTTLVGISPDGMVEIDGSTFYTERGNVAAMDVRFEKHEDFIAVIPLPTLTAPLWYTGNTPREGDWLRVVPAVDGTETFPQVHPLNQGVFRIVRVQSTPNEYGTSTPVFWIENTDAIEEDSYASLVVLTAESVVPGDLLVLTSDLWGAANKGIWEVDAVGVSSATATDYYSNDKKLRLVTTEKNPVAKSGSEELGFRFNEVQIMGKPARFIKKIVCISPNKDNGAFADIRMDTGYAYEQINATAGSIITALDKFDFPTGQKLGLDGYQASIGLVGEANRIVYGDPNNSATYPGVAASGARINIQGPLIKRIRVSLALRVRSGLGSNEIADRVRSAVASVVNKASIGAPIALSDIVSAASKIPGVIAVSIISPLFRPGNDLVPVQPDEKAMILNADQDISIVFTGE